MMTAGQQPIYFARLPARLRAEPKRGLARAAGNRSWHIRACCGALRS